MLALARGLSRGRKLLIVVACAAALVAAAGAVYTYERYYRGPSDSVLVGTWYLEDGCIDCTHFVTLFPNHNVLGFSDALGQQNLIDHRGRWYAGGQVLVIHYDNTEQAGSIIMRILDIEPDTIRVRWDGRELRMTRSTRTPPQASNQALELTATVV